MPEIVVNPLSHTEFGVLRFKVVCSPQRQSQQTAGEEEEEEQERLWTLRGAPCPLLREQSSPPPGFHPWKGPRQRKNPTKRAPGSAAGLSNWLGSGCVKLHICPLPSSCLPSRTLLLLPWVWASRSSA